MYPELFSAALAILLIGVLIPVLPACAGRSLRLARTIASGCMLLASVLLAALTVPVLLGAGAISMAGFRSLAFFPVSLLIDRLAAFFILIIAAVSACVAIYGAEYIEHLAGRERRDLLAGCMNLFVLAMVLVVASADMLSFFFWELMAAASFLLVMYGFDEEGTPKAGLFYFAMTQLSALFVLFGILVLSAGTGTFSFPAAAGGTLLNLTAFIALFLGFSIKAGIIPFHKWLPYAHPASPSPVSALMSGVMLKIAVYGLLRFLLGVFSPDLWHGILILLFGTLSAILGIMYALKEQDLKGMLAYSSIENIGIIFMGTGLWVIFSATGFPLLATLSLLGALFHSLNHALLKSLLFLAAGSVVHATGTRNIEQMGGLASRMPWTSALFFLGAAGLAALPPLNGFASEILIFTAFFQSIAVVDPLLKVLLLASLALFALTGALAAACFVKAFGSVFLALPRSPASAQAREVPLPMIAGPAILAVACILLGLLSPRILSITGFSAPVPDMLLAGSLLLGMAILVLASLRLTASRAERISPTWGCGAPVQEASAEYTGHGFSAPLDIIFRVIYRTRIRNERTFFDQKNILFREGRAEIRLIRVFEEYLYLPAARASLRLGGAVSRFQNGCLDTYILYVFVTVLLVIFFLGVF